MASLVVGLSKTVVAGTLAKVEAALEDAEVRKRAERDLDFITGEFQMMETFLNDTNDSNIKNKLVMTWVRNVRELAYDLKDCVEFVVHLDSKRVFWRRIMPKAVTVYMTCVKPLPLDQAVAELGELKARAEELSKRYLRYNNLADAAGSKLIMLQQPASSIAVGTSGRNMLAEATDAATRRKGFVNLAKLITKKDNVGVHLQAVSVWGTAGDFGKTSIIRKVYHDPEICQNFRCRAWVKLVHPFNPHEFIRHFMAQVYTNNREQRSQDCVDVLRMMEANPEDLLQNFVEQVNRYRYFVVLEDLSSMLDWDAIRTFLPDMSNGSWIIVSTQQFETASLCVGQSYQVIELEKFSADHSVYAFFNEDLVVTCTDNYSRSNVDRQRHALLTSLGCQDGGNLKETAKEWMEIYPLTGRESEINRLHRYTSMERPSDYTVLSIWGIPGIGKSALIRNLYCDAIHQSGQFEKYRWVDVSHPFDLRNFCSSLLLDSGYSADPIKDCKYILQMYHCLIVIDDLRSKEEWDLIQTELISIPSEVVIIVITTEASIARHCSADKDELVFNLSCLEDSLALELFDNEVRRNNTSFHHSHSVELKELILMCGGLPKVIVALAYLLATKTLTWIDTVSSLNGNFIHHLETNPEFYSLRALFGWMHSILCNSSDSLKPCILYLTIFPRNHVIRRRRLVRRWIAEGYSRGNDGKSVEEEGEKHFSELLELAIIQQPQQLATSTLNDTRMVLCQMQSFIREYIVSWRMEENLVFELGGSCALTTQRMGRHLIILQDWERGKAVFESMDFSRLHSLTVFGDWESFFISESMKVLRVLDLEDAHGVKDADLVKIVKLLRRLKFLSLRRCINITCLPSSLGYLRQLETLDVRDTCIVTLPESTSELKKLQYIRSGSTFRPAAATARFLPRVGVEVPRETGRMTALLTLGVINVAASGRKSMIEEIKKLTQLRKLGVAGINGENSTSFFSAIRSRHLESLSIQLDTESQDCLQDIPGTDLVILDNLISLKLYGLNDKLPEWSDRLSKLTKLNLEMATLKENDMKFLGNKLPQLCILCLHVKQLQDGELHFRVLTNGEEDDSYQKIKVLQIACSSHSSRLPVIFGSKTMKNLELLKIHCGGWSPPYHFSGMEGLKALRQVLLLKGYSAETLKEELESQLLNHPNKPAVNRIAVELERSS